MYQTPPTILTLHKHIKHIEQKILRTSEFHFKNVSREEHSTLKLLGWVSDEDLESIVDIWKGKPKWNVGWFLLMFMNNNVYSH